MQRVSAEADNARALLLDGNVIQMFVGTAGLGNGLSSIINFLIFAF